MFNKYPYINYSDLNLDKILIAVKESVEKVDGIRDDYEKFKEEVYNFLETLNISEEVNRWFEEHMEEVFDSIGIGNSVPSNRYHGDGNDTNFNSNETYVNGLLINDIKDLDRTNRKFTTGDAETVPDIVSHDEIKRKASLFVSPEASEFRFAYRVPDNYIYNASDIIESAAKEKIVYNTGLWTYQGDVPGITTPSQIPLYDINDPTIILNPNGKVSSCANAISNILYNIGEEGIAGDAHYTEARVFRVSLPYYLQSRGWKRIDDRALLREGDIVFTACASQFDERKYNPSHSFIYAGANLAYDFGSTALIRNGGVNEINWNASSLRSNAQPFQNGIKVLRRANLDTGNNGNNTFLGIEGVGKTDAKAFYYDPMTMHAAAYMATMDGDPETSPMTRHHFEYPITKINTYHGCTFECKLYANGFFKIRTYYVQGHEEFEWSSAASYRIFSLNVFRDDAFVWYTFVNQVFNKIVCVAPGVFARIRTENRQDSTTIPGKTYGVTDIYLEPINNIPRATEMHFDELIAKY